MHQHPLENLLLDRGWSFQTLEDRSGVSSRTIQRIIKNGRRGCKVKIRHDTAVYIAESLELPLPAIFGEDELTRKGRPPLLSPTYKIVVEAPLCQACRLELPTSYKTGPCPHCDA